MARAKATESSLVTSVRLAASTIAPTPRPSEMSGMTSATGAPAPSRIRRDLASATDAAGSETAACRSMICSSRARCP